jgi:hypothetical protein
MMATYAVLSKRGLYGEWEVQVVTSTEEDAEREIRQMRYEEAQEEGDGPAIFYKVVQWNK